MSDRTELDLFVGLSKILTGEKTVDRTLASQYLDRLKAQYAGPMTDLLDAFGRVATDRYTVFEVKRQVIGNPNLKPLAQQVITIWYTSEFAGPDGKVHAGTQDQYYGGLLWRVIRAHAPTDSTQPYGYWEQQPILEVTSRKEG